MSIEAIFPILGSMAAISAPLIAYVIIKKNVSDDAIIDKVDMLLTEISTNPEMQKKVYTLGILLGNGIKNGVGIAGKGGKFKFEDIIGQGIGILFQNMMGKQGEPQTSNITDTSMTM